VAFACSSATSALCGSSVAISLPWATCSPCETSICVTVPLVLKPRSSWLAGSMLPLPETVDCTTPRCAVTVRVTDDALPLDAGPTTRIAAAIAPASSAASAYTGQGGPECCVIGVDRAPGL
jgi:hypothetical protein